MIYELRILFWLLYCFFSGFFGMHFLMETGLAMPALIPCLIGIILFNLVILYIFKKKEVL